MRLPIYTGRQREPGLTEQRGVRVSWRYPPEDPDEGCPGAWRRNRFVGSMLPFLRRRDDHGGRVSNPFHDRCDDELVLALVNFYEDEHERAIAAQFRAAANHGEGGTAQS
ncbi:MAG: hypothetical protein AAF721_00440 [Myxococcota bacterium]